MPVCGEAEALTEQKPATHDDASPDIEAREVGVCLREARIALGYDLADFARELRTREAWLLSLEEGRLDELPDAPTRAGLLRSYANCLGLDGAALAARLGAVAVAANAGRGSGVFFGKYGGHFAGRRLLVLTTILAVAVAVGGGWYLAADGGAPLDRSVPILERSNGQAEETRGAGKGSDTLPVPEPWAAQSRAGSPIPLLPLGPDSRHLDDAEATVPASPADEAAAMAPAGSRASGREPAGASTPSAADRRGSTASGPWDAERIRSVQRALARLGYDPGPFDGVIGPRTRAAIRSFQAASGLTVDGRLTRELEREIRSAPVNGS